MTEWLMSWNAMHWFILGAILLILEITGTAGLLLWTGIAAFLTGSCTGLMSWGFYTQGVAFALFSILTTSWWYVLYRRRQMAHPHPSALNQRIHRCIGSETALLDDVAASYSRVKIDDTVWRTRCNFEAPAGTLVRITAVEGSTLIATRP